VSLAKDGKTISLRELNSGYTHAENLTIFISEVVKECNFNYNDLDAIAVSMGPGSYTGLRIGVSTAKGLCYALNKPLIAVSTLQHLALSVSSSNDFKKKADQLFCPMIDARRMEVFCAVFDASNNEVAQISAEIIDGNSFNSLLKKNKVLFFGNGALKCREVLSINKNAYFIEDIELSAKNMCEISFESYKQGAFEDVSYFEPYYLKDFLINKTS
jgi:tRNA threonylcarbamoyladenosine biosynthesis protein TsaB